MKTFRNHLSLSLKEIVESASFEPIAVTLLALFFTFVNFGPFLSGEWLFYHDSLSVFPSYHLFYDALFQGKIALWNPYQNSGEPLWFSTEAYQTWDPVAFLMFGIARLLSLDSLYAYQLSTIGWLFVFALGGMYCSKQVFQNHAVSLSVFILLFAGPIAKSAPAGSPAFILPFRYLPWLFYFTTEFFKLPSFKTALLMGTMMGLVCANYQTLYSFPAVGIFLITHVVAHSRNSRKNFRRNFREWRKFLFLTAGIALLWWCPTFVSWIAMQQETAVARVYFPYAFILKAPLLLFGTIDFRNIMSPHHGSAKVGVTVLAFLILGGCSIVFRVFKRFSLLPINYLEIAWILVAGVSLITCSDFIRPLLNSNGTFLGVRNWGDSVTLFALALVILFSCGVRLLLFQQNNKQNKLGRLSLPFITVLIFLLFHFRNQALYYQGEQTASFIPVTNLFFPLVLLFIFLPLGQNPKKQTLVSFLIFIFVFIDVLRLSLVASPHIENSPARRTTAPHLSPAAPLSLPRHRSWNFPAEKLAPYHVQGPALHKTWNALLPPLLDPKKYAFYGLTHLFRIKNFDNLVQGPLPESELKRILGVSSPLLRWEDKGEQNGIEIQSFTEERIHLEASTPTERLLVYTDNFTPDWRATLDGHAVPLRQVHGTLKGLLVPPGKHEIIFNYLPLNYLFTFWIRAIVSFFTIIVALGFCWRKALKMAWPTFLQKRFKIASQSGISV